jgi:hypothetical protein
MKQAIAVLNDMVSVGVIQKYAIGGAMGATFYTEPFTTFDLDIFVMFGESDGLLVSLSPIYAYLRERGYTETTGECVMIEGTPVQFLPTSPGLLDEAMQHAVQIDYDGVPTWVLGAEYLLAIAVSTGRAKDRMRVPLFLESGKIDLACLTDILERHALFERWETWAQQ